MSERTQVPVSAFGGAAPFFDDAADDGEDGAFDASFPPPPKSHPPPPLPDDSSNEQTSVHSHRSVPFAVQVPPNGTVQLSQKGVYAARRSAFVSASKSIARGWPDAL